MIITLDQLRAATGANEANAEKYLKPLNDAMGLYNIDDPRVVAGFLSQVGHESGGLATVVENLNYRVAALTSLFGRHRISEADAKAYGRDDATGQKANQEAIANIIYGGDFGRKNLGNTEQGDGWKYRGRGLKQLTGRANYKACGESLGLNLIDDPDQLAQPVAAALSAAWFWASRRGLGIEDAAEAGDVRKMTKLINGGDIGLPQREALYAEALRAIEVA
jgi:putative chitinase